jgi:hypothetical protein
LDSAFIASGPFRDLTQPSDARERASTVSKRTAALCDGPHCAAVFLLQRGGFTAFVVTVKTFHLSFPKTSRPETRIVVKTQQFIICMNEMMDAQKSFLSWFNAFVFSFFRVIRNPVEMRWRRRCSRAVHALAPCLGRPQTTI